MDTHTLDLMHQVYARVCIELDVTQELIDQVWIGTSKEHGWVIDIEYEGNHALCEYCGLLGHIVGLCRKKREAYGKAPMENKEKEAKEAALNKTKLKDRNQWQLKSRKEPQQTTQQMTHQTDPII